MTFRKEKHAIRGMIAGAAGGLVAAWVMNVFMEGPGQKLQQSLQNRISNVQEPEPPGEKEDATMKAADAVVSTVTGGRHLSHEERKKGGPLVHYGFGAAMGALYGGLAEYFPRVSNGFGSTFGGALFTGADLIAVPGLHLSPPLKEQPGWKLANPFAAHVVYGSVTELVRRVVRAAL